jgi:hypothetical protein
MFPVSKLAVALWVGALILVIEQQFYSPFLVRDMLHSWASLSAPLGSIAGQFRYAGGLAAIGAVIQLLSEIRAAAKRTKP